MILQQYKAIIFCVVCLTAVGVVTDMRDCPIGSATVDGPRGYLLGGLAAMGQHASGTDNCPWVIRAKPGQQISIQLYDFAAWRNPKWAAAHHDSSSSASCAVDIVFREGGSVESARVCSGTSGGYQLQQQQQRERPVFTSRGSELHVHVVASRSTEVANFLLKYEGTHKLTITSSLAR